MLTRIRNAQRAGHRDTRFPASRLKFEVAKILEHEKFIEHVEKELVENRENIVVTLKYTPISPTRREPAIQEIDRVSKEGRRVYVKRNEIKKVKNGYGIAIVSTPQGVMTGGEAFRRGIGGEYICRVW